MSASIKLHGFREMEATLKKMKTSTAVGVVRRAMKKALTPVADDARAMAPVLTGQMQASILISPKAKGGDAGKAAYAATLAGGGTKAEAQSALRQANKGAGEKNYTEMFVGPDARAGSLAHLLEFGTGPRYHKGGKSVGAVKPHPFLRPAWDKNVATVLEILSREMRNEIDKTLARIAKKAGR